MISKINVSDFYRNCPISTLNIFFTIYDNRQYTYENKFINDHKSDLDYLEQNNLIKYAGNMVYRVYYITARGLNLGKIIQDFEDISI